MTNFQRDGASSNSKVGFDFGQLVLTFFSSATVPLVQEFPVDLGVGEVRKRHRFDFGCEDPPCLIECKSHAWTTGGNIPSAKMTVWNEAMYYFHLAPARYRKMFVVLKHMRADMSLASYYVGRYAHLIPKDVEIWEFDPEVKQGLRVH